MAVRIAILPVAESRAKGLYLNHAQLALGQIHQLDLLDSDRLAGAPIERLVNSSESTLAYAFSQALSRPDGSLLASYPMFPSLSHIPV